jgi:CBS-domain-containing membrane protein
MSSEVLSCFEDQPVENVAKIMAEHGVRRLPVLDRRGRLTGIVSLSDVTGGELRKKKPYAVTFFKHLTDGRGMPREVPIRTVHVAAVDGMLPRRGKFFSRPVERGVPAEQVRHELPLAA